MGEEADQWLFYTAVVDVCDGMIALTHNYAKACEAELAAVRAGDRNFPGIGLPPDLARRP